MKKYYDKKDFTINSELSMICVTQDTRSGFRHLATLYRKNLKIATAKCTYQNRTWEVYQYQSVIHKLLGTEAITDEERKAALSYLDGKDGYEGEGNQRDMAGLKMIAMVAKMGEIFGKDQKGKNDWKERMIRAGLEGKGLIIPDDWNELNELQREERLNGVIAIIGKE